MIDLWTSYRQDCSGAVALDYVLIGSVLAVALVFSASFLGDTVESLYNGVNEQATVPLNSANDVDDPIYPI